MPRRLRNIVVGVLVLLGLLSISGCAGGRMSGAEHCPPRWPSTSDYIVREAQTVAVSASASTCQVQFTHDRRLVLTGVDHTNRRFPLGTVQAYASGAFEREVRIPAAAATGPIYISIDGFDLYCPPNASCAGYAVGVLKVDSNPNFSTNRMANSVASRLADRTESLLDQRPSLVQLVIVSDGLQATIHTDAYDPEVAAYKKAFAEAQRTAPPSDRAVAAAARLHITSGWRSKAQLERLMSRIGKDRAWQKQHGYDVTSWARHPASSTVRITLKHYNDRAAIALTNRYGDAVSVSTRNTAFHALS